MKKLTLILTLLVSTVMFSSPSYAKWMKVEKSVHGDNYYVDFERMRKVDGYVYFWSLENSLKPDKEGILSTSKYFQVDCKLFRYKGLSGVFYKEPMGEGTGESYSPKNPEWEYPPPNSSIESILKSVCSR